MQWLVARGQGLGTDQTRLTIFHFLLSIFLWLRWWVRQVSGDAAYENYLRSAARSACDGKLMTREEFYLDLLRRRYTSVSRCC
jgi:uncharacterized short protein YbdD (DUF466 family)